MSSDEVEGLIARTWRFDAPEDSAAQFALLADRADAGSCAAVVLRSQQARALGLAGRVAEADALLDECESHIGTAEAEGANRRHARARVLIERGRLRNSAGEPAAAAPLFEQAEQQGSAAGVPGLALDAVHMQAIVAGALGDHQRAERLNRRALAAARNSADPAARAWAGSLLNNLGWTLFDTGRLDESLEVFTEAVAVRAADRDAGGRDRTAEAEWAVGRALRELGRTDEAGALQQRLLRRIADPAVAASPGLAELIREELAALGSPTHAAAAARGIRHDQADITLT